MMDPAFNSLVLQSQGTPTLSYLPPLLCFPLVCVVSACFVGHVWMLFLCPHECFCDASVAVQGGGMICGPGSTC